MDEKEALAMSDRLESMMNFVRENPDKAVLVCGVLFDASFIQKVLNEIRMRSLVSAPTNADKFAVTMLSNRKCFPMLGGE